MEPVRTTFWDIPGWLEAAQYVLGFLTVAVFAYGVYRHIRVWRSGKPEPLEGSIGKRVRSVLQYALLQGRLRSDPSAFVLHLAILWGMGVLFIGTILATADWDVTHLLLGFQFLKGKTYLLYEVVLDVSGFLVLVGLGVAIVRRYVLRVERLKLSKAPTFQGDSFYLLTILLGIILTGFLVEGLRLAAQSPPYGIWAPVGVWLSEAFRSLSVPTLRSLYVVFWSLHGLLALGFIATLPFTKAFHIVSSPANIFFRRLSAPGELAVTSETGARRPSDFTWRQLLQLDACTWCGKCSEACPAIPKCAPRELILNLAAQLRRPGENVEKPFPKEGPAKAASCSMVTAANLWTCLTCRACEEVCPVFIEHIRLIVDMRRSLLNEGEAEAGLQEALVRLSRYGNSFGKSERMRPGWTKELSFHIKDARKETVDWLWFVGDYASYDPRLQRVTRTFAELCQKAALDFGILYDAERNSGNDVRRTGEEGLFQMLKDKNRHALDSSQHRRIVTTDPHTYNTLLNEYNSNGSGPSRAAGVKDAKTKVLHSSQLLDELVGAGVLQVRTPLKKTVTYHDPCYLGRYNGVFEAPRRVLRAVGATIVEMPHSRLSSRCCGAGGGKIWMQDLAAGEERPAENRVREAAALPGVSTLVVACPKDFVMFQDAVKTTGNEGKLVVKDLAELVGEAISPDAKEA